MLKNEYENLAIEHRDNGVVVITINRPQVANAFNTQTGHDLKHCFSSLVEYARAYRCVVLTGAGDKAFCAGADLKERNTLNDAQWVAQHEVFERAFKAVLDCPVPVIAAVNGAAYAGGLEIMLQCDFTYASTTARFALTEVSLGIMPGGGGTQLLPRIIGERRAKELILAAKPFSAEEAYAWGLVNKLCKPEELMAETIAVAERIAGNAPISVRTAKHSIHRGLQMDLDSGMLFEIEAYQRMVGTSDRKEGIAAFNEKRKPKFTGQ